MRPWKFFLPLLASSLCFAAQPDRITGPINSSQTVALSGNVHRLAKPQFDQPLSTNFLRNSRIVLRRVTTSGLPPRNMPIASV
jgi:hypothetical protein